MYALQNARLIALALLIMVLVGVVTWYRWGGYLRRSRGRTSADPARRATEKPVPLAVEGLPDASMEIVGGRDGRVIVRWQGGSFPLYWELGGNDVLASIHVPAAERWTELTGLPAERRAAIVAAIGRGAVARQTRDGLGSYALEGDWIVIQGDPLSQRSTTRNETPSAPR